MEDSWVGLVNSEDTLYLDGEKEQRHVETDRD